MTRKYKWKVRQKLVAYLRSFEGIPTGPVDDVRLEEHLADLSRSDSWLASEAKAAIHETSNAQWRRLRKDVDR